MMRYPFPLLMAICISYLGLAPNEIRLAKVKTTGSQILIIQILEANAQQPPSSTQKGSAYDRYMKEGYQAMQEKDYQKAKAFFEKAVSARPGDSYAKSALNNVQKNLGKPTQEHSANAAKNLSLFSGNSLWLIIGLSLLFLAFLGALISFLTRFNKGSKSLKFSSSKPKKDSSELEAESSFSGHFFNKNNEEQAADNSFKPNANSGREYSLPVQPTTRIPSLDLIEELIKSLEDPDSKNRRKSIWKLAQVSDSRAMKPLVDLMIQTDSYERSLILEALSQVCSRTLRPMNQALAISLQDKNSQVRKNAIRDLTRLYDLMSQINELLCYALDDENIEVQETAKWALSKLNLRMPIKLNLGTENVDEESTFEEDIDDEDINETDNRNPWKT
ncbi:HEAT repeat domain-containing protein [Gloeothece verrucosa]|uniref:Uncharacterized protein n=1 Tax=Gloeothece verrucosa (strain PCC 7822) TaxID=497965 RepID=E0UB71_GLOV7|nr:HEAT repeat domain-containing protein [Gloeothece verrucosa]ADN16316.1 conserved hypothetical protein [Gloeothece verrucosa PCC 7822]